MKMRATILGCGSSGGVPRPGIGEPFWGACDPQEPKNRRRRCSLLVEQWDKDPAEKTVVLVDTAPDMREQLIDAKIGWADGVLFTHDHADQCHGIDDLRILAINKRQRIECWMDAATRETLLSRFGYCFRTQPGTGYPAILNDNPIAEPGKVIRVEGPGGTMEIMPFDQDHGTIRSLGFRFGPLAYSADAVGIPDESFALLDGIDCWIADALRYTPHPTHAHVEMTLGWLQRAKVRHGILTNMHVDLDYGTLASELPDGVEPAYDGMQVAFEI
ncbi:MAG: phosphoribosyl 1,2-cyclic phosphodiesterase [Alphaproteobacteria bacterium HGW-Alphaproteobacteria-12]|nr:MAG: phosphoribosyl 1,2-cyclic phosphodiesterase [Alphaproteobacteria bacterium HGW-Alphaproteobacteria-12]